MKLWILGKNGFIGHKLWKKAVQQSIECVATSHQDLNVADRTQVRKFALEHAITHIINCAAYTRVDDAEHHAPEVYATNANGPKNLGMIAREFGIRVVHISTDYVFDGESAVPYKETDVCRPLSVYGHSKWLGEVRLLEELPSACIVRPSWVFGLGGKTVISMLVKLLQEKEHLSLVADQKSCPTYCDDLCGVLLALKNASGIFHFANRGGYSRYEVALSVRDELEKRGVRLSCREIVPIQAADAPFVAPRPHYSVLDTTKVTHYLKVEPRAWEEVMREFVDHAL